MPTISTKPIWFCAHERGDPLALWSRHEKKSLVNVVNSRLRKHLLLTQGRVSNFQRVYTWKYLALQQSIAIDSKTTLGKILGCEAKLTLEAAYAAMARIFENACTQVVTTTEKEKQEVAAEKTTTSVIYWNVTSFVAVSDAVRRARAGLQDPNRPIGSFIFLGPTGVGKTELAKALAEFLFDDDTNIVRIDMSEYMEKHSVARLIGAPPGYVGYDEGGQLTEAVRRRPYSVVLLDEIEKAHGDVFNILLQVLDDGRLTDSKGRTVDFRNTVVIMTSNVGAHKIMEAGGDSEKAKAAVMSALKSHFRPEFINRIDDTVIFDALTRENMDAIFVIQMKRVQRLLDERQLLVEVTPAAQTALCDAGFDPTFGARPLKRAIQQYLLNPMSKAIVSGGYGPKDTIKVELDDEDQLIFTRIPAPEEEAEVEGQLGLPQR